ncbi:hypothetical protein C8R45DRAFT_930589 [Mycena sanguinolenta]|nr:hypothetical protein C8R45DRAFT_930589 [Mycena sanguinolenta]
MCCTPANVINAQEWENVRVFEDIDFTLQALVVKQRFCLREIVSLHMGRLRRGLNSCLSARGTDPGIRSESSRSVPFSRQTLKHISIFSVLRAGQPIIAENKRHTSAVMVTFEIEISGFSLCEGNCAHVRGRGLYTSRVRTEIENEDVPHSSKPLYLRSMRRERRALIGCAEARQWVTCDVLEEPHVLRVSDAMKPLEELLTKGSTFAHCSQGRKLG